jgi:hypothetical protein
VGHAKAGILDQEPVEGRGGAEDQDGVDRRRPPGRRIRQRAYEIWEREGRPEGREQAHWEQAEREVAKVRGARQAAAGR